MHMVGITAAERPIRSAAVSFGEDPFGIVSTVMQDSQPLSVVSQKEQTETLEVLANI